MAFYLCLADDGFSKPVELDRSDCSGKANIGSDTCWMKLNLFLFSFLKNRSYVDVSQMDPHMSHQMSPRLEPDDRIYWHEDSKPGTIV